MVLGLPEGLNMRGPFYLRQCAACVDFISIAEAYTVVIKMEES